VRVRKYVHYCTKFIIFVIIHL